MTVPLRRHSRNLVATAAVAVLVTVAQPPAVSLATGRADDPGLRWRSCPENAALVCSELEVPLDHADPGAGRVRLALVKAPAADPAKKRGTLVINRGGPGFSSTDYLRSVTKGELPSPVDQRVWDRYDVIGLDQRGVGHARPAITCFPSTEDAAELNDGVAPFPVTASQARHRSAADAEFAGRCRRHTGPLLDHLSTATVARDLDLVRHALGEPRLNFLGQSYGVHLGLAYANLFPHRIGSLVLDSVLNPARSLTGPAWTVPSERTGSDVATRQTLGEFLRLCARGTTCPFTPPDPHRAFRALTTQLQHEPLRLVTRDGTAVTLTYQKLTAFTVGVLYQPVAWPMLATVLDLTYRVQRSPADSDTAELADWVRFIDGNGFGSPYSNLKGSYLAYTCNDAHLPTHPLAWWITAQRRAPAAPHFAALRAYDTSGCAAWRAAPAERYTGPWSARTDTPVLILTSRFDPATPAAGAYHLHDLLPNSRLLVNEGWGHVTTQQSTCMTAAASGYLATGALPRPGATCRPDHTPFA